MDFKRRNILMLRISALLVAVATALLFVCFLTCFDAEKGYFESGEALPTVFYVAFAVALAFSLAPAVLMQKDLIIRRAGEPRRIHASANALAGTLSVLLGMLAALEVIPLSNFSEVSGLIALGMFGHGAYLLLGVAVGEERFKALRLICLGCSASIPMGLYLAGNSSIYYHSNCVENQLASVFAICFLIYILNEGKLVATGTLTKWRYCAMLAVSVSGLCLSIAYILAYFSGAVADTMRFMQMIYIAYATASARILMKRHLASCDAHTEQEWAELEAAAQETAEAEAGEEPSREEGDEIGETDNVPECEETCKEIYEEAPTEAERDEQE